MLRDVERPTGRLTLEPTCPPTLIDRGRYLVEGVRDEAGALYERTIDLHKGTTRWLKVDG